jgi:hypothetical protein
MSERIPGWSQNQMIALWQEWVKKKFRKTQQKVRFNGKTRNVFTNGKHLYVLDEYHGDLEVLDHDAKHLGTNEIDVDYEAKEENGKKKIVIKGLNLGKYKPGGKHKYEFV